MYCDDPICFCVGVERAVRMIVVWYEITSNSGLMVAKPSKWQLGAVPTRKQSTPPTTKSAATSRTAATRKRKSSKSGMKHLSQHRNRNAVPQRERRAESGGRGESCCRAEPSPNESGERRSPSPARCV